jgi:DNA repair exonuclease SbcCD nuclease subunit
MKLLLFSDLHLDRQFKWAGPVLGRQRRHALRETLKSIVRLCAELKVDGLMCGGDLCEQDRFTPDTVQFISGLFATLEIPVFLAPGNHDWFGPDSIYQLADWTPNVHVFTEDKLTPISLCDGLTLWGAAHRAPANTDGFLSSGFKVDRGGVNLALFHGSEYSGLHFQESGKRPHAPFHSGEIAAAGLDHAFLGHFHTAVDGERHTYPGNPEPLSFGEVGPRGAVLATIAADGSVLRERFRVATSQVTSIEVCLDVVSATDVRDRVRAALSALSGTVRVTLNGEVPPSVELHVADLAGLGDHLDAFLPQIGRIRVSYDLEALLAEQTIRGQFVRDVSASQLEDEVRRRVLVTGLRALDGRSRELEVH